MPGQAYSAPWVQRVKEWAAKENESVFDGPFERALRMIARTIGADDHSRLRESRDANLVGFTYGPQPTTRARRIASAGAR